MSKLPSLFNKKTDKKLVKQWIKALRSKLYKQGRDMLCDPVNEHSSKYCCLGVLCEIALKKKLIRKRDDAKYASNYSKKWSSLALPSKLRELVGLSYDNEAYLANLNDNRRKSFRFIADLLEKALKEVK